MSLCYNIQPQDWIRKSYARSAVDTAKVVQIRYAGKTTKSAAAHVSVAATTGDLTFEQGATTAAAAVTTGVNPGTSGVIDISALSTIKQLYDEINDTQGDWEAWPIDYLPDGDIEVTAANAIYLTAQGADNDCTGAGLILYGDTSLETAEIFPVGVTLNGPSTQPHNNDRNVLHEIIEINANADMSAAGTIKVYECDDRAGTSVLIDTLTLADATATEFALAGEPLYQSKGKRLVVEINDAGAFTSMTQLQVAARSYKMGPSMDPLKSWSRF